jgi:hypothetical protein
VLEIRMPQSSRARKGKSDISWQLGRSARSRPQTALASGAPSAISRSSEALVRYTRFALTAASSTGRRNTLSDTHEVA